MRKFIGILLIAVLMFGSLSSFGHEASAAGQRTIVPDAKATIQLEKTQVQELGDDRKLIVEGTTFALPLLDGAKHVTSLPIRMENSKGDAVDLMQDDIVFTSSNKKIFTIEDHMMSGKKVGAAYVIIKFQGKETRIQVQVKDEFVALQFEDERAEQFFAFYARYYNAGEKSFDYMEIVTAYDENTNALKVYGIDWSKPGPYYVDFMVDNAVYAVEITQADKNKTKVISMDLAQVTLDTGKFPISQVNTQFMKQGVAALDGGLMSPAFHYDITPGDYVFNVSAVHEDGFYMVSTPVQSVKAGKQVVPVSFNSTVPIKVSPNLYGASFMPSMYVCNAICEDISGDFAKLHVSKGSDVAVSPVIENESLFYQLDYEFKNVSSASELKIDDQFKSTLKFEDKVYKGGSELYLEDVLSVKNTAGANLMFIYDESFNFYGGLLTFENVDDANETYTYELNHYNLDTIVLPNVTGKFNVTFSFGEITPEAAPEYVDLEDDWYHWADTTAKVATNYTWTIRYNAPVIDETVSRESIFVTDSEGYVVKGAMLYVDGDTIYVYAPEEGYMEGQTYYLCIRNSVQNIAGKSMKHNIKMDFVASDAEE